MHVGIFESVFNRPTLSEQFNAVAAAGFASVQFHYASAGLESEPTVIPDRVAKHVRRDADESGIRIAAVSGAFNMIHPEPAVREHGLTSLEAIAATCDALGTSIVTLCTGTRSTVSQWTFHPDNVLDDAWDDLLDTLDAALEIADKYHVTLAFEPEPANVARNAGIARRLLDAFDHSPLKIILDPANIIASDRERPPETVLSDAFDLLGDSIVLAHAKDLSTAGEFCPAGTGVVPWKLYRSLLERTGFEGDVIFHSLAEHDVALAISSFA
jgi:sugar phosphate isomerase/epimerase